MLLEEPHLSPGCPPQPEITKGFLQQQKTSTLNLLLSHTCCKKGA